MLWHGLLLQFVSGASVRPGDPRINSLVLARPQDMIIGYSKAELVPFSVRHISVLSDRPISVLHV